MRGRLVIFIFFILEEIQYIFRYLTCGRGGGKVSERKKKKKRGAEGEGVISEGEQGMVDTEVS